MMRFMVLVKADEKSEAGILPYFPQVAAAISRHFPASQATGYASP
jgi:hypothetical protein